MLKRYVSSELGLNLDEDQMGDPFVLSQTLLQKAKESADLSRQAFAKNPGKEWVLSGPTYQRLTKSLNKSATEISLLAEEGKIVSEEILLKIARRNKKAFNPLFNDMEDEKLNEVIIKRAQESQQT